MSGTPGIRWESLAPEVLLPVLRAMPANAAWPVAIDRLRSGRASLGLARFVADGAPGIAGSGDDVKSVEGTPYGAVAAAEIAQNAGDAGAAERHWTVAAENLPDADRAEAELVLARLVRSRDKAAAGAHLRRAARLSRDIALWRNAAKLLERLGPAADASPRRKVKIALVSSADTQLFAPVLRLALFRDGVWADILETPIGNHRQESQPGSELHRFAPDFVILSLESGDFGIRALSPSPESEVARVAGEIRSLCVALRGGTSRTILCDLLPAVADDAAGHLGGRDPRCLASVIASVNRDMTAEPGPGVVPVDIPALQREAGTSVWHDAKLWHAARQRPAPAATPLLAGHYASLIGAALGLSRKVLVLDLDNTVWHGVIGEDGLGGIRVGPPSAEGEAHAALQRFALELRDRGVLLAVCSKNNDADAKSPFEKHDGMVLKLADIAAFVANWTDKPTNLRAIAKTLNLGADSLVFLDDNPVERRLVERELPEVAVVPYDGDPSGFVRELAAGRYFQSLALSSEDLARQEQYKANAEREAVLQSAGGDMDAFLRDLRMEVTHGAFSPMTFDRNAQLFGKTNQFNLTSRRHTREGVEAMAADPKVWTRWFKLADRFGDNGLVGQLVAREIAPGEWEVDSFLMSCRVIGRKMEDYMAWLMATELRARGAKSLRGVYAPTAKNAMVAELYPKLGYARAATSGDSKLFVLDLENAMPSKPDYFVEHAV